MLTATTWKAAPPSFACSASSAGISLRHGTHQVAQRLSSTVRPRQSASGLGCPSASWKVRSGSRSGSLGDRDRGHFAARQRRQPLRECRQLPAGTRRPAGLRWKAAIPYTAASPPKTTRATADDRRGDRDAGGVRLARCDSHAGTSVAGKPR